MCLILIVGIYKKVYNNDSVSKDMNNHRGKKPKKPKQIKNKILYVRARKDSYLSSG